MLSERRIKEAEVNVKSYLSEGLLTKSKFNKNVFNILRNNAQESLSVANFLNKNKKSSLWIIVTSYYSMFYLANALIYKLGYKIGSRIAHKVTADALIVLAKDKVKQYLIENFEDTLKKIKTREVSENSWIVPIEEIKNNNYDLTAKNPNKKDEFEFIEPKELLNEIETINHEVSKILKEVREVL